MDWIKCFLMLVPISLRPQLGTVPRYLWIQGVAIKQYGNEEANEDTNLANTIQSLSLMGFLASNLLLGQCHFATLEDSGSIAD